MKDLTRGELLFSFVCFQLLSSVVSLNWTVHPPNPTVAVEGQTVSLTWRYSLTANEQTSSQSFYVVKWSKFSSSMYEEIAAKTFIRLLNPPFGYREPLSPHIVVDKNNESNSATLHINDVRRDDEGRYKIEYISDLSGTVVAGQEVNVSVLVPPALDYMSNDTDVCEGSLVRLSCNATGVPQPSITWTQVSDKDTDSAPLPTIDGTYVILDVNRSSNGTIYRCNAENQAGAANRTVQVTVKYSPLVDEIRNSSNTVTEGGSFSMTCGASGGPEDYTWIRIDNGKQVSNEAILIFNNISRNDTGQYRCEAKNQCGNGSRVQSIDVYFPPHITDISRNQTVTEGDRVYLNCTPDGNPPPSITWTRLSNNSQVTIPLTGINRQEGGVYRCTADNGVGRPATKDAYITVQFPTSIITNMSRNMTKNDGDELALTCKADGNPEPKITWTRPPDNTAVPIPFIITGKQDEGAYRCTANNSIGSIDSRGRDVFISVLNYRPFGTSFTANLANNVANLSETFDLTCSADASPTAKYRLYREQESLINTTVGNSSVTHLTTANKRKRQMIFRCTPFNEYGDGPTKIITVTVHYPPFVTKNSQTVNTTSRVSTTLLCPVSGNPDPNITWHKVNDTSGEERFNGKNWTFKAKSSDAGWYVCFAKNVLGTASAGFRLTVEEEPTSPTQPGGTRRTTWRITLTILDKDCKETGLVEQIRAEVKKVLARLGLTDVEVTIRCGSVIVDLVLRFNQTVRESDVISSLKTAATDGQFGGFKVDPDSIKATQGDKEGSDCEESFFKDTSCSIKLEVAIGISVAAVVVIIIVTVVVGYWIHKKRKCRKDTRIAHDPGCEEQRLQGGDPHAQVNNGYAETGPPSANSTEKAAAVVPDYTVVDKSTKKKKKQDEEKPPEYAVEDKSKKKKKNEKVDDTYAKVDMSKKRSKKKPRPGEDVVYADLGDINGTSQMPAVATSPKAQLHPLKRPEGYEGTQYADITQFLKGDAILPKDEKQGTEMKEKDEKTDRAGGENAPKGTLM